MDRAGNNNEDNNKSCSLVQSIKQFDLMDYLIEQLPKQDKIYNLFGIICFISTITTIYAINAYSIDIHSGFILFLYQTMLLFGSFFLLYSLWPAGIKTNAIVSVVWYLAVTYILAFCSMFFVFLSNFERLPIIILTLNITLLLLLTRWKTALVMLLIGAYSSIYCYKLYIDIDSVVTVLNQANFIVLSSLVLVFISIVTFLRPQQEEFESGKATINNFKKEADYAKRELENVVQGLDFLKNQFKDKEGKLKTKEIYLKDQLKLRNIEISKLKDLKDEFIRNIPHETNTPMTGILSLSEVLYSCYDSLDEKLVKQSIKDIVSSSDRLKSFVSNIADLSKLSALTYELNKTEVDLSELARERPVLYKKIFADDDKQEFIFKVEDKLIVQCDEYYITQAIDSLISNAVKYGQDKPITISLARTEDNKVQFNISDEGIGIPKDELISIFHKFTVSSKTQTPAGGRGVGLALCEKVITVHGGRVEAKSDGKKGSDFSFVLPL